MMPGKTEEIHEAGPMVGFVQRCARCGTVLSDYRNSMIPEGDPPPHGWEVGAHLETDGVNPRSTWVTDKPATCEELAGDSLEDLGIGVL